jgi:hypothetical protein
MNRLPAFVIMAAALLAPGTALGQPVFDDPVALLEYAYAPYSTGEFPDDPNELFSERLIGLIEADAERTPDDEVGALDFDPFLGAQDYQLEDLTIETAAVSDDQATVEVSFVNLGLDQDMLFFLVREGEEGWKIDDIESTTPNNEFRLSEVLTNGWGEE